MSDEQQEMQFADPAWQPKVTREFEAITPSSMTGAPPASSGTTADPAPSQGDEALFEDYNQGYRVRQTSHSGSETGEAEQVLPPLQSARAPHQGPQVPYFTQQPPTGQQQPLTLQDQLKQLPGWVWWVVGIIAVLTVLQPATSHQDVGGAISSLLLLAFLASIGWLLWTRRMRIGLTGEAQVEATQTFTVGAQPTLILKNKAGSINLHGGEEGQIEITATRRGYLFSQLFEHTTGIWYSQDSAKNSVTARTDNWHLFGKNAISFDVAVPPQTHLQLETSMGTITIENVAGRINLKSDAGTINATNVTLQGKSRLKTDLGTVTFNGDLEPGGNYELTTNLGTIDVSLPTGSSFDLKASTDLGTVTSDFSLPQTKRNKLSGGFGNGVRSRLKLKTDIGTITLHQN